MSPSRALKEGNFEAAGVRLSLCIKPQKRAEMNSSNFLTCPNNHGEAEQPHQISDNSYGLNLAADV